MVTLSFEPGAIFKAAGVSARLAVIVPLTSRLLKGDAFPGNGKAVGADLGFAQIQKYLHLVRSYGFNQGAGSL